MECCEVGRGVTQVSLYFCSHYNSDTLDTIIDNSALVYTDDDIAKYLISRIHIVGQDSAFSKLETTLHSCFVRKICPCGQYFIEDSYASCYLCDLISDGLICQENDGECKEDT